MIKSKLEIATPKLEKSSVLINYSFGDHHFQRGVGFPEAVNLEEFQDDPIFQKLICYMAISDSIYTFGLDYYDVIETNSSLDEDEANFFEKVMFFGLAEFRYINNIDMGKKVKIVSILDDATKQQDNASWKMNTKNRAAFVLNGGGKDCVVAIDIAAGAGLDVELLSSGYVGARQYIAEQSGLSSVNLDRITDGYVKTHAKYKGHKPMSLYVAFASILAAYVFGKQYVVSANEYSANFANLEKDGVNINHQYTKSLEFERDLQEFLTRHQIPVKYFSATRQLYELQVLDIFAQNNEVYHAGFISCNENIRENKWCLACPKCAFVLGAMYLFNEKSARRVWGTPERVFSHSLVNYLVELVNPNLKPLECIGTREENCYLLQRLLQEKIIVPNKRQLQLYESYLTDDRENNFSDDNLATLHGEESIPLELVSGVEKVIRQLLDAKYRGGRNA